MGNKILNTLAFCLFFVQMGVCHFYLETSNSETPLVLSVKTIALFLWAEKQSHGMPTHHFGCLWLLDIAEIFQSCHYPNPKKRKENVHNQPLNNTFLLELN